MSIKIAYLPKKVKDTTDKKGKLDSRGYRVFRKIDGNTGHLYVRYTYKSNPTYFKIDIGEIRPDQFNYNRQSVNYLKGVRKDDKRNQELINHLKQRQINDTIIMDRKLAEVKAVISSIIVRDLEPTGKTVKQNLQGKHKVKKASLDLQALVNEFIASPIRTGRSKGKRRTNTSKDQIRSVFKTLYAYFEIKGLPKTLDSFDRKFYDNYTYFLECERSKHKKTHGNKFKNMDVNTRGNQVAKIKAFLSWVEEKKDYQFDLKLSDFIVTKQRKKVIYLSEHEISKIKALEITDTNLAKARDLFILHCRIGLRYSDLSRLGTEHIKGNTIQLRTHKADTFAYIPIVPDAREIIDKYIDKTTWELHLPKINEQDYNGYLKQLGRLAGINDQISQVKQVKGAKVYSKKPKYEALSSHKAVSTFITLSAQRGIPVKTISQIVGKTVQVINSHYLGDTDQETIEREMIAAYGSDMEVNKS